MLLICYGYVFNQVFNIRSESYQRSQVVILCRRHQPSDKVIKIQTIEGNLLLAPPSGTILNQIFHLQMPLDLLNNFAEDPNLLAEKDLEIQMIEFNLSIAPPGG